MEVSPNQFPLPVPLAAVLSTAAFAVLDAQHFVNETLKPNLVKVELFENLRKVSKNTRRADLS